MGVRAGRRAGDPFLGCCAARRVCGVLLTRGPGVLKSTNRGPGSAQRHKDAAARPGTGWELDAQVRGIRLGAGIGGAEVVEAEIAQFAFEALDVEPQHAALGEHQHHIAARRLGRVEFDAQ